MSDHQTPKEQLNWAFPCCILALCFILGTLALIPTIGTNSSQTFSKIGSSISGPSSGYAGASITSPDRTGTLIPLSPLVGEGVRGGG